MHCPALSGYPGKKSSPRPGPGAGRGEGAGGPDGSGGRAPGRGRLGRGPTAASPAAGPGHRGARASTPRPAARHLHRGVGARRGGHLGGLEPSVSRPGRPRPRPCPALPPPLAARLGLWPSAKELRQGPRRAGRGQGQRGESAAHPGVVLAGVYTDHHEGWSTALRPQAPTQPAHEAPDAALVQSATLSAVDEVALGLAVQLLSGA
jgi:hypothetical protein